MTKKKLLKLIAAGVALVLLLVFVPFPLHISRTYYGYIHQGENAGKDVTAQLKGWRFYYLFAEEEWRGLKLELTADDGTELDPALYESNGGHRFVYVDKKPYITSLWGISRANNTMESLRMVHFTSFEKLALDDGQNDTLITLSTDKDKADADVLKEFEYLKEHGFAF